MARKRGQNEGSIFERGDGRCSSPRRATGWKRSTRSRSTLGCAGAKSSGCGGKTSTSTMRSCG